MTDENDRSITGFTMLAHGIFHTYELSIPIFIVIWLDVFDVSPFVLGIVFSIGYGLIGVGAIPSGVFGTFSSPAFSFLRGEDDDPPPIPVHHEARRPWETSRSCFWCG